MKRNEVKTNTLYSYSENRDGRGGSRVVIADLGTWFDTSSSWDRGKNFIKTSDPKHRVASYHSRGGSTKAYGFLGVCVSYSGTAEGVTDEALLAEVARLAEWLTVEGNSNPAQFPINQSMNLIIVPNLYVKGEWEEAQAVQKAAFDKQQEEWKATRERNNKLAAELRNLSDKMVQGGFRSPLSTDETNVILSRTELTKLIDFWNENH